MHHEISVFEIFIDFVKTFFKFSFLENKLCIILETSTYYTNQTTKTCHDLKPVLGPVCRSLLEFESYFTYVIVVIHQSLYSSIEYVGDIVDVHLHKVAT